MSFPYTDHELEDLRWSLESDLVERKSSAQDKKKIHRAICAFANDLPSHGKPGVIIVGIDDKDGRCSDVVVDDDLLKKLANMSDDGAILPRPSLVVQKRTLGKCEVALVLVHPSMAPPVRYRGRVWVRVGPTTRQASVEEEQRLGERRRAGDLPFDTRPAVGASLEDLDLSYARTQYLPRAVSQDILEENRRPLDQQLRSLRLLAGESPTGGALLGLGRDPLSWLPGAYVQVLRIDGTAIYDPIVAQRRLSGRLEDVLRQLNELLSLNIRTNSDLTTGPRETRHPDYPLQALQQLAFNAVMHRTYEGSNAPVRIYWYRDRIEINSPGGLYGQVTPSNFGEGVTDYRNPLVAEIMYNLGFAQQFGSGIPLARRYLEQNGNPPPDFDLHAQTHVTVTLRPTT